MKPGPDCCLVFHLKANKSVLYNGPWVLIRNVTSSLVVYKMPFRYCLVGHSFKSKSVICIMSTILHWSLLITDNLLFLTGKTLLNTSEYKNATAHPNTLSNWIARKHWRKASNVWSPPHAERVSCDFKLLTGGSRSFKSPLMLNAWGGDLKLREPSANRFASCNFLLYQQNPIAVTALLIHFTSLSHFILSGTNHFVLTLFPDLVIRHILWFVYTP